jgi:MoaA/NifB/PqqE/SkfB family radical SAM enzyme
MNKENISAIIPIHKKYDLNELINSIADIVGEIILINSSNQKLDLNYKNLKIFSFSKKLNASESRNLGIERASKKILFFLDFDVVLTENGRNFIKSLQSIDKNELIGGIYVSDKKGLIMSNINSSVMKYRFLKEGNLNDNPEFISSSHFLVKKNKIEDLGMFNENINSWEDVDLCVRSKKFNTKLRVESFFETIHKKKYNFFNHFTENIKKSFAAGRVKFNNLKMYKGTTGQLPYKLKLYLMPFPILILLFITTHNYNNSIIFLAFITLILSILNIRLFDNYISSLIATIYLTLTTPIFALSNFLGKSSVVISYIFNLLIEMYDFIMCGFKVLRKNGSPIQFIQYVTARCNLRCDHCFYKETLDKKDAGEISEKLLVSTAESMKPILWYSMAGGEPFIRKDLSNIITKIQHKTRPKIFSLPTNGWYKNKTFNTTLKVLQTLNRGNFLIFFSIDGNQKVHDEIRGKDSFAKLKETYFLLSKLKQIYPRLYLNLIITVQNKNYNLFPNLIREIYEKFLPTSISINLLRYHYKDAEKLDPKLIKSYELAINEYEKIRKNKGYNFLWNSIIKAKEKSQKELILRVAKNDEFVTPCTAGNLSYVGMEDGSIKPCEILPDVVGNIYKENLGTIFKSNKSDTLRKNIVKTKCRCTYECAMSTNTLFNFDQQKGLIKQSIKDIFS